MFKNDICNLDLMETSIAQAVYRGLENETWQPCQYGSQTTDDVSSNLINTNVNDFI